ncbi:hypothetical protein [Mesorhizobium sp. M0959]|uniref:hypothetical protein n=1 Tax=unclassified Mesorhizobium TaxID=325217 RepID=UPI00333CD4A0
MTDIGIKTPDIAPTSAIDSLIGSKTVDGLLQTRRISTDDLALQLAAEGELSARLGAVETVSAAATTGLDGLDVRVDTLEDIAVSGIAWKAAVRVATTVAGTLASSFENGDTVDGVVLATGDRILIKDQAAPAANGVYTINAAGAPTRAEDANTEAELLRSGVSVTAGTANAGKQWVCTTTAPITVDTTALTFVLYGDDSAFAAEVIAARNGKANLKAEVDDISGRAPISIDTARKPFALADDGASGPRVTDYVSQSGQRVLASAKIRMLNDEIRPENTVLGQDRYRGHLLSSAIFAPVRGQSLAFAHVGGANETLTQIGRSVAYPYGNDAPAPDSFKPAIATDADITGATIAIRDGESPMFGVTGHMYEMIERENGLKSADIGLMMVTANNSLGSTTIAQNNKGTARYNRGLAQLSALKTWCTDNGKPLLSLGTSWYQGEANNADSSATYYAALVRMARDEADDMRAILTGADEVSRDQTFDPILFTYATCSRPVGGSALSSVPRAQLRAAVDFFNDVVPAGHSAPAPVVLTAPNYFMDFSFDDTGVHVPAVWAYMLGAYAAEAQKRVFVDEWDPTIPYSKRWPPLHPIRVRRIGNTLLVKFKMRALKTKLRFAVADRANGEGIREQENFGFALYDTGDASYKTMAAPQIVGPDEIAFTRSSGVWVDGLRLGYGIDNPSNKTNYFVGSAGNVADDYGRLVRCDRMNLPMHNWLSPHYVMLDASAQGWTLN